MGIILAMIMCILLLLSVVLGLAVTVDMATAVSSSSSLPLPQQGKVIMFNKKVVVVVGRLVEHYFASPAPHQQRCQRNHNNNDSLDNHSSDLPPFTTFVHVTGIDTTKIELSKIVGYL
eukprot:4221448-Ditylum_brightwellii.AAC.1